MRKTDAVFLTGSFILLMALCLYKDYQLHVCKVEAVRRGVAEWKLINPATGRTEFQWLPIKAEGGKP